MELAITGQHLSLTPALRAHVTSRFEKLERHLPRAERATVVLHCDRHRNWAEATIPMRGRVFHATASANDLYAAIDRLARKLDRRALSWRKKNIDRAHRAPNVDINAQLPDR